MIEEVVAFMPIRLNSQRIKEKSIADVQGRPMFCWSLETLDKLNIPVYVYTNDEERLREKLDFQSKNIIFLKRPKYLDDHDTKGIEIYKEFAKQVPSKKYLLVHCTSPFVKLESYKNCIEAVGSNYDSSLTVKEERAFCWFNDSPLNFEMPRPKTQDLLPVLVETSAAYCYLNNVLDSNSRSGASVKLVKTRGEEIIDIDNQEDLDLANTRRFQ